MSGFDKKPVTQLKEITGPSGIKGAYKKDNMYFIPTGTTLYRGDSKFTDIDNTDLLKGDYKFFTPDENYAYKYGLLFEFKTTTDLNLVAMDDISEQFYNKALKSHVDIAKIMEDNYGYGEKPQKRDSDQKKDNAMSKYICDERYQGYAANTMKSEGFDDDLNAEVIICNPENHLIPISRIIRDEDQSKLYELNMRRTKPDRVGPSKKPRREVKPPSMGSLAGEDDSLFRGSLFGGKTKKSKKSKKKQSKKKKTKTQKKRKSRKSKTSKK